MPHSVSASNTSSGRNRFWWLRVFPVVGVLLLAVAVFFGWKHYRFIQTAPHYTAIVIDVKWQSKSYYPLFEFKDASGDTIHAYGSMGASPPMFKVGETVEILYDEHYHEGIARNFFSEWMPMVILGFIGALFTGIGAVISYLFNRANA